MESINKTQIVKRYKTLRFIVITYSESFIYTSSLICCKFKKYSMICIIMKGSAICRLIIAKHFINASINKLHLTITSISKYMITHCIIEDIRIESYTTSFFIIYTSITIFRVKQLSNTILKRFAFLKSYIFIRCSYCLITVKFIK